MISEQIQNLYILENRKQEFCISESFNTGILHQLFYYKITFVNSQREKTNSKGDIVPKNLFETFVLKISGIQK